MCNCMTEIRANIARDLAIQNNVYDGVITAWDSSVKLRHKNKMQRSRVIDAPAVSLTARYRKTTTKGQPFKQETVEQVTIKPKFCCMCGGKL